MILVNFRKQIHKALISEFKLNKIIKNEQNEINVYLKKMIKSSLNM